MIYNTEKSFGFISKVLHWLIASVMIFLIALGWYMTGLSYYDPLYHMTIDLHKALGIAVFIVLGIKVGWILVSPLPKLDKGLKKWEFYASSLVHKVLWALIIILPITGYIISTSADAPISFFGFFDVPAIAAISDILRNNAIKFHYYISYGGAFFIALHIAASLKHHFINKDDTLKKMI